MHRRKSSAGMSLKFYGLGPLPRKSDNRKGIEQKSRIVGENDNFMPLPDSPASRQGRGGEGGTFSKACSFPFRPFVGIDHIDLTVHPEEFTIKAVCSKKDIIPFSMSNKDDFWGFIWL